MGSKGGGTTVMLPQAQAQTTTVAPNPVALAGYANVVGQAQNLQADNRGFTPDQQQAFNQVQQLQGVANPWINSAGDFAQQGLGAGNALINSGANATSPQNFGQNINAYMSPYMDDVVKATMANINETNAQQQSQLTGNAIAQGALGGNRVGVAGSELARQQNLTNNATLAQILQQGYGQAGQNLFQNAGLQMQAGNSLGSLGNQTAGIYSGLGNEALSTGLQGANALLQTGGMQQALPYQQLGWLSGIINNTGPNMGQTGTQNSMGFTSQYQPQPNMFNSLLGAGVAGAGMLMSDERVKEDAHEVGKLHDGQKIYRFRYKGEPGYHVGLMAQEVEKHHPEAVGEVNGVKGVDYREATKDAVRKARGGGLGEYDPRSDDYDSPVGGGFGAIPEVRPTNAHGLQLPAFLAMQQAHQGQQQQDKSPSFADFAKAGKGLRGAYDSYGTGGGGEDFGGGDYEVGGDILSEARGGRVRGYDDGGEVIDDTGGGFGGVDDPTFARMIKQESGGQQFDKNGEPLTSPKGAVGVAQLMPNTAPEAFALAGIPWDENRYKSDPEANKKAGAAYYQAQLQRFGDPEKAAAAYNAGPGRLSQALARADAEGGNWRSYLPQETRGYLASVAGGGEGLGAINAAAPIAEGRSADTGVAPPDAEPGFLEKLGVPKISPDTRAALISAGLGMMASKSHWLGPAIGEGGLQGIKTYYQNQQNTRQNANTQSEIGYRSGQLGVANERTGIERAKLQLQLQQNQRLLDAARAASGMDLGAPPLGGGPTVPGGPVQPSGAPLPLNPQSANSGPASQTPPAATPTGFADPEDQAVLDKVDPRGDPRSVLASADNFRKQAEVYRHQANVYRSYANPEVASQLDQKSDAMLQRANEAATRADALAKAPLPLRGGGYAMLPSVLKAQAAAKENETAATEKGKRGTQMFEMNKKPYEETAAAKDLAIQTKANAQAIKNLVFDENGKPIVSTGPQGEFRAKLAANMEQSGWFSPETIKGITSTDPANAEAVQKLSRDMVGEVARQALGPGNRLYATEYKNYVQGVPSVEILPRTIQFLTDRIITPKSDWLINRFAAIHDAELHGDNIQSTLFKYDREHPLDEILSSKKTAPSIPAAAQRENGKVYQTPNGPRTWRVIGDKSGWEAPAAKEGAQ